MTNETTGDNEKNKKNDDCKNKEKIGDYYKDLYKEAMSDFRYFGNLRAQIAWQPATIIVAAITFALDKVKLTDVSWLPVSTPTALVIVFAVVALLIFFANYYLQTQQNVSKKIAVQAHKNCIQILNCKDFPAKSYSELKKEANSGGSLVWPDRPSWLLLGFLVTLAGCVSLFVLAQKTDPPPPKPVRCNADPKPCENTPDPQKIQKIIVSPNDNAVGSNNPVSVHNPVTVNAPVTVSCPTPVCPPTPVCKPDADKDAQNGGQTKSGQCTTVRKRWKRRAAGCHAPLHEQSFCPTPRDRVRSQR